jgi:hypothetical protein
VEPTPRNSLAQSQVFKPADVETHTVVSELRDPSMSEKVLFRSTKTESGAIGKHKGTLQDQDGNELAVDNIRVMQHVQQILIDAYNWMAASS